MIRSDIAAILGAVLLSLSAMSDVQPVSQSTPNVYALQVPQVTSAPGSFTHPQLETFKTALKAVGKDIT